MTSAIALFLLFASCLGTRSLAMPPVPGTLSGRGWAFLFALCTSTSESAACFFSVFFFFFVFLFVIVFVLLPVASGSWAGGSLLSRLWLPMASCILLDLRLPSLDMLGTRGCPSPKTWG